MADCVAPTLSAPDLTCISDLSTWATLLTAEMQAALNTLVGCIEDFEYPQCDICVLKDDLVDCPLSPQMIDFSGIPYCEDGGIGCLPYPDTLSDLAFKYGIVTTGSFTKQGGPWATEAVTFTTPFPNSCEWVGCTMIEAVDDRYWADSGPDHPIGSSCAGGFNLVGVLTPVVQNKAKTGFTVHWLGDDYDCEARIKFMYLAVGT